MQASIRVIVLWLVVGCILVVHSQAVEPAAKMKIVLVAGEITKVDKLGHHDYPGGIEALRVLLSSIPDVETVSILDGWPKETSQLDHAACVVFYTDGGGKQAFLQSRERIESLQRLVDQGTGLVMIHQAVDFPAEFALQAKSWIGGIYLAEHSGRGHWPSKHVDFPRHEVTRGVSPWEINDGWLNQIVFVDGLQGVVPLVWSGKQYAGSRAGLDNDIVAWAYERPRGGRSFCFTGLDAHSAWAIPGVRQLVLNGTLWAAGSHIPESGAPCEIGEQTLLDMQTPREAKQSVQP
ncbi:MAG: ThuA domain-containing protein [Planctomycetales bacterium]|nr:ThuA domain-containing protein [Planctomycetales bacterium]